MCASPGKKFHVEMSPSLSERAPESQKESMLIDVNVIKPKTKIQHRHPAQMHFTLFVLGVTRYWPQNTWAMRKNVPLKWNKDAFANLFLQMIWVVYLFNNYSRCSTRKTLNLLNYTCRYESDYSKCEINLSMKSPSLDEISHTHSLADINE